MFDVNNFRTLLKFEGITLDDYTDEELNVLIQSKITELKGLTGIDILPVHRKQYNHNFRGKVLRLDFYPVKSFISLEINGRPIKRCKFNINEDLGIIYFPHRVHGDVNVKYLSGIDDDVLNNVILPLIREMIAYTVHTTKLGMGDNVSSIKEGDVSVNYDTSNGRGSKINSRITDLKNQYNSARLRWL